MKNLGHSELETTEEDCGIEIVDLDPPDVTASSTSFWLASKLLQWQRSTCALCILLFITILFSLLRIPFSFIAYSFKTALYPLSHSSSTTSLPAPLPPPKDGIACLEDSSCSPDSTSIAVLGYQDCPKNDYVSGLVNLYNAQSRQMVGQLQPGDAILQALGKQSPSLRRLRGKQPPSGSTSGDTETTDPPISYEHVIWSPDNQRLAVTFEVTGQQSSVCGVWLADRNGQSVHVLLQQKQTTLLFYLEWDLNHLVNTPPSAALALKSLPLALVYHWRPNGQLVPETLLTNTTTVTTVTTVTNVTNIAMSAAAPFSPVPVGNSDGASSFTIWQPGSANFMSLADPSSVYPIYTWSTDFAAWSPNGSHLLLSNVAWGLVWLLSPQQLLK